MMRLIVRLVIGLVVLGMLLALLGGVLALSRTDVSFIGFTPSTMSATERGNIIFGAILVVALVVFGGILGVFRGRRR